MKHIQSLPGQLTKNLSQKSFKTAEEGSLEIEGSLHSLRAQLKKALGSIPGIMKIKAF